MVRGSFSPSLFAKGLIQNHEGWDAALPGPHVVQPRSRSRSITLTYWLSR
jgi:hypothetical protein